MEQVQPVRARSPYLLEEPPTSAGRILLSRGLEHYCGLHWGYSAEEIVEAFAGRGDDVVRMQVLFSARLLGELFGRGVAKTWARPFGGGESVTLRASAWELDDFAGRFSTSALDPARLFDPGAVPTHWIFVDADELNGIFEASVADVVKPQARRASAAATAPSAAASAPIAGAASAAPDHDRLLRLDEVRRRTGLSRSTIYRRMRDGRFPGTVQQSGSVAAWRDSDVSRWVADPI